MDFFILIFWKLQFMIATEKKAELQYLQNFFLQASLLIIVVSQDRWQSSRYECEKQDPKYTDHNAEDLLVIVCWMDVSISNSWDWC